MKLIKPLGEAEKAVIDLLEEALKEAKRGAFHTVAIVVCKQEGYATVMAGNAAADLYLAVGSLQRKIMDTVEGGNVKRPSILHAVPR